MITPEQTGMLLSSDQERAGGWVSHEVEAMIAAWERGAEVTAQDVLDGRAQVDTESAIRLIYEETCLRREAGQQVGTAEVVARFPRWGAELRSLFECDRLIRSPRGIAIYPEVGETLGPFLLLEELGRGQSGRTFLASDPALADRQVVVKVIPDDQDEHLALARLRHTHIVPLFSEHTFPERGLRGLCMPFLGGTSLARILDDLAAVPVEQRTGALIIKVIDRHSRSATAAPAADGPFRRSLEQASYVDAMTWIASCLADALHYSHARGLIHMDLKPSNVLITMDGQPMLLDFHLARGPILAGEPGAVRLGGTPGWMSPEQEQAMAAIGAGHPVPLAVDGRSDIFALGLLLGEAISALEHARDRCSLRREPGVSLGVLDILRKCLAPKAGDRYDDPATLAEDLRRELNDLPLRGVRNRSVSERFCKWRRRHPGVLAWVVVVILLSLAAGVALAASMVVYHQRVGQIRLLLHDGKSARAGGRFEEAIRALGRGLDSAAAFPAPEDLKESLRGELRLAERARLANELCGLADRIRLRGGLNWVGQGARASERSLDLRPQEFWPNFYHGLCSFRLRLFELAVADFQACLAIEPGSAVAHYNCALAYDAMGCSDLAFRDYTKAIELDPSLAPALLNRGILSYRIGRHADAVVDFDMGLKAGPDRELSGRFRFNLALAQLALRDRGSARVNARKSVELGCREAAALFDELR